jgi:hypothetical protein
MPALFLADADPECADTCTEQLARLRGRFNQLLSMLTLGYLALVFVLTAAAYAHADAHMPPGIRPALGSAVSQFLALLTLLYATIVGHMFGYLFDRSGGIHDTLLSEASAVARVIHSISAVSRALNKDDNKGDQTRHAKEAAQSMRADQVRALAIMRAYVDLVLSVVDSSCPETSVNLVAEQVRSLHDVPFLLAKSCARAEMISLGDAAGPRAHSSGLHSLNSIYVALRDVLESRSARVAAILADLPDIQLLFHRSMGLVLLVCFLLVDTGDLDLGKVGEERAEDALLLHVGVHRVAACLFGALCTFYVLLDRIIVDLKIFNRGYWNVTPARDALQSLLKEIDEAM